MRVAVICESRMLGDVLAGAVERSGHTVGTTWEGSGPLPASMPEEAVLVHWDRIDGMAEILAHTRRLAPAAKTLLLCRGALLDEVALRHGGETDAVLSEDDGFDLVASSLAMLEAGYRVVRSGSEPVQPQVLPASATPRGGEAALGLLSPREKSIMVWILEGLTNKQIARELQIKDSTVKVHLRSVYQKIRVHNRTQAAVWARQHLERANEPRAPGRMNGTNVRWQ